MTDKDARIAELVAALDGLVSAVSGWERVILNGLPHIVTVEPGSGFDAAFNAAVQALAGDGSAGAKVIQAARAEVIQAAHDLLCWTYQHAINVEPADYSRNVRDLHPGVFNTMNSSERDLFVALLKHNDALAALDAKED